MASKNHSAKLYKQDRIDLYKKYKSVGLYKLFEEQTFGFTDSSDLYIFLMKKCRKDYENQCIEHLPTPTHKYSSEMVSYQELSKPEKLLYQLNMDSVLHDPCQPYDFNKDLCAAYNRHMVLLPHDEDWAIFIDHDAIWTTYDWKRIIAQYIESYPEYSCFTCLTNRIGNPKQLAPGAPTSNDYAEHREFGKKLAEHPLILEDFTVPTPNHLSGVVIVLHKEAWRKMGGFTTWSDKSNILGVDSAMHRDLHKAGLKTGIMKNLYVYHWYRGGSQDKSHLQ
jgi:hypothetical protein